MARPLPESRHGMLVELRIRNVAVIEAVSLPLAAGLNVLSGETGAGKSLIVGALGLLLGERAAADRLRTGADKASVEGVFDLPSGSPVRGMLEARGVDADDDVLILKRELTSGGRSRAWINGTPVTAALLAEVGAQLVSMHGQHEAQQLLTSEAQRDVLDGFAGARELAGQVANIANRLHALRTRQADLDARRKDAERRADYLRFVVQEIEAAAVRVGEEESLEADVRRLAHAEELRSLAASASGVIAGDDEAILSRLAAVRRALTSLQRIDDGTTRWQGAFDGAVYSLEELARELDDYAESIDADPSRLMQLESRRDLLHALTRKYGPTLADVLTTRDRAREELDLVDGGALDAQVIGDARKAAEGELVDAASRLTRLRSAAARSLGDAVTALLPELGMTHGRFVAALTPLDDVGGTGAEQVAFLVALNAGSEPRPLSRVASGGELARVMLALSTVLARLQEVPTLVFDEVDAGVGGTVAWQVGALMRRVAGHHQVLAISHLAQIAARAHHHVVVRKGAVGSVTTADTGVVTGEERVVEIARMLGGDADREVSRAHARELLERGDQDDLVVSAAASPRARSKAATRTGARDDDQRRGKPV